MHLLKTRHFILPGSWPTYRISINYD